MNGHRHPFSQDATSGQVHLRIAASSDLHAALRAYDYFADKPADTVGLTRIASLVKQARREAENTIFIDNGDLFQGNPLGDAVAQGALDRNPFVAVMNALGLDAATLGNHDFNFGMAYLQRALSEARYPVVLGNIVRRLGETPLDDAPFLPPWTILDRQVRDGAGQSHDLRIGILGVSPPQSVDWDRDKLNGCLASRAVMDAVPAHLAALKAAGADIVVALSHGGIGLAGEGPENASARLAAMDGIDAVIMGHVHKLFPDPGATGDATTDTGTVGGVDWARGALSGKPAVMPGDRGSHLGVIDLLLDKTDAAGWTVRQSEAGLRPVARLTPLGGHEPLVADDPEIEALTRPYHAAALQKTRHVVARTTQPLCSYFAYIGRDSACLAVTAALRHAATPAARQAGLGDLPLLAAGAPFMAGGRSDPDHYTDVAAGDVAIRDLADLYPFPDRIAVLHVTGADLRGWLERSAAAFLRIEPGAQDAPLIDPDMPSYHFDLIDGLRYRIDLSQGPATKQCGIPLETASQRITDLTYEGRPVRPDDRFLIATNNYRAGGGGHFPGTGADRVAFTLPDQIPDMISRYLTQPAPIPPLSPVWSFVPMPGTSALFRTGPGSRRYLQKVADLPLQAQGSDDEGFMVYRLHL